MQKTDYKKLARLIKSTFRKKTSFSVLIAALVLTIVISQNKAEGQGQGGKPSTNLATTLHIHDGDTIRLDGIKYRLEGIDAPELEQTCKNANGAKYDCGIDSRNALRSLANNKQVTCNSSGQDKYKRELGTCFVDDININAWMVENGYAVAFRKYSEEYVDEEDTARTLKKGIWQGSFITPDDYRKLQRQKK